MDKLSGADMLIRALQDEGVEYVFGYPGGAVLHIYDALFNQEKIKHILVRHEQGATHMADGYARATGRTGVVLVTSGPGATNAITGIATAYMDSIPMVVVSGLHAAFILMFIRPACSELLWACSLWALCAVHVCLVSLFLFALFAALLLLTI